MSWLKRFSRKERLDRAAQEQSKAREMYKKVELMASMGMSGVSAPVYEIPSWGQAQNGLTFIVQHQGMDQLQQLQQQINQQAQLIQQNIAQVGQQRIDVGGPIGYWQQGATYNPQHYTYEAISDSIREVYWHSAIFGEAKIKMVKEPTKALAKRNLPDWF